MHPVLLKPRAIRRRRGRPRDSRTTTPRTKSFPHPSEQRSLAGGPGYPRGPRNESGGTTAVAQSLFLLLIDRARGVS